MSKNFYILTFILALCAGALVGCGRKGALEPPPSASAAATSEDTTPQETPPQDRAFILDRLIQ